MSDLPIILQGAAVKIGDRKAVIVTRDGEQAVYFLEGEQLVIKQPKPGFPETLLPGVEVA